MKTTTLILCAVAAALALGAYFKQEDLPLKGFKITGRMLLQMAPMLVAAFVIAGQLQMLLPKDIVAQWLGKTAGLKAILIGSAAGALTPGGPYVSLPIAVSLSKSGASVGCVVAYLIGWTMWGLNGLAFEISILGLRLTVAKRVATLLFPPVAGILAQLLFGIR